MANVIRRIIRPFRAFWQGVSVLRRFTANLIFLVLIIFLISVLMVGERSDMPEEAALVMAPAGTIVEKESETVLAMDLFGDEARQETQLRDLIDAIDSARDDRRIKAIVLDLRNLEGGGLSALHNTGEALLRFRESGKTVLALADFYTQPQYYLAAHANRVYLHPMGGVLLTGFGLYRQYFKTALEKLRIDFHVFRVGTYKSALEPFLRDDMSEDAKQANLGWLTDLWNAYATEVIELRGLERGAVDRYVNQFPSLLRENGGDMARLALDYGLIDGIKTRDEIRKELIELVGEDEKGLSFRQVAFEGYLEEVPPKLRKAGWLEQNVGVIIARGVILDGNQPTGRIGGDSLAELIAEAREDDRVRALVLRIDSGGGSAFASDLIRREIEVTSASGKPVVVSMGAVAASGGYWIASGADEIWAAPTTLTGSIGIFGAFPTFDRGLKVIGISNDGVGTTRMADAFDPGRPLNPMVEDAMQQTIEHGYRTFLQRVAEGRKMDPQEVEKLARGRVWSGKAAHELGLVDRLGDLEDAVASAAAMVGLIDFGTVLIEQPMTAREKIIQKLGRFLYRAIPAADSSTQAMVRRLFAGLGKDVRGLKELNDPRGIYAYCLECELAP
jgi:protease-4